MGRSEAERMRAATFVVVVLAAAVVHGINPPASPQDEILAESITSNFACKVDSVEVNMDVAGSEEKTTVTADDLKTALARTATLEWAHVNQFFFASDGRNDEKNLLTGGGDMVEFIQGLIAYSKVTGAASLTQADVTNLFERYLKIMSKSKFYFQTDEKAYYKLAVYTGCPNLKIAEVGERAKKKAILDAFASEDAAEFIGDPYIAFLLKNADTLDIPKEYITYSIVAFHEALWANNQDSQKLCYTEVKGRVDPKAILHIKTPGYCVDQGLAPLLSSQMCTGAVMIDHSDSVKLYRRELCPAHRKGRRQPPRHSVQLQHARRGQPGEVLRAVRGCRAVHGVVHALVGAPRLSRGGLEGMGIERRLLTIYRQTR